MNEVCKKIDPKYSYAKDFECSKQSMNPIKDFYQSSVNEFVKWKAEKESEGLQQQVQLRYAAIPGDTAYLFNITDRGIQLQTKYIMNSFDKEQFCEHHQKTDYISKIVYE